MLFFFSFFSLSLFTVDFFESVENVIQSDQPDRHMLEQTKEKQRRRK